MAAEDSAVPLEHHLRAFLEGTAATTGEAFFHATARHLARALGVKFAFVARCVGEERTRVGTLAFWAGDGYLDNWEYDVAGTPCEYVLQDKPVRLPEGIQQRFPADQDLRKLDAQGYVAVPIHDSRGLVAGHLGALDTKPLPADGSGDWVLHVFAARAGAEFDRLHAEARLRESEERARVLLDRYFDGITLVVDGVIAYANPALCALAGFTSAEQMVGRSPTDFIVPAQRAEVSHRIQDVLAGGPEEPQEYQGLRQDGSEMPVEVLGRRIEFNGRPAILAAVRDLTLRRQSETALRASEAELRAIFEKSPIGMVVTDGTLRIVRANQALCSMLGYEAHELIGQRPRVITHPDDYESLSAGREQVSKGRPFVTEKRYLTKHGESVLTRMTAAPILDAESRLVRAIIMIEDIEEQRKLEQQARQSQRLESIGQLTAGIAHNFNNALTAITGYSELLTRRLDATDPAFQDLTQIQRVSDQTAELIRQLLAFSQIRSVRPIAFELNDIVETARGRLGILIGGEVKIHLRLDRDAPVVRCDRSQMEEVLGELILNASGAMPDGGMLTIETTSRSIDEPPVDLQPQARPGIYGRVRVSDTGVGMEPSIVARVFEPFFTTSQDGSGIGLGLSVAHGAVTQNGGWIEVTSTPGTGSVFDVYLPTP